MQLVTVVQLNSEDIPGITPEALAKLNQFIRNVTLQMWALQGNNGTIKPSNNIDMQGKYKVINQAT